jgi:membrane-bound lytic murein transglycosylase B
MNLHDLKGTFCTVKRWTVLFLVSALSTACFAEQHPGAEEFAQKAAAEHQLDPAQVIEILQGAHFKQSIVDAISRPAEAKPWYDYRPIFMTEKRINGGVEFWRDNESRVKAASERYGVDPEFIVAIIGVETFYGKITGSHRVLDALTTLAFYYPNTGNDRSAFFSGELMNFLVLGKEEGLPVTDVTGSYAGAMGLGQFMPSSYRAYAVDLDRDGRRDLWRSLDDVIGSVANYLHEHGWQAGEGVAYPLSATTDADQALVADRDYRPAHSLAALDAGGYASDSGLDPETQGAVVRLEEREGPSYWFVRNNFYVITRYNRSPLYAMAVVQLAEAIRQGMGR